MSTQKITPNIPMVKIMNPILRILLIFAWNPLIPANNPVKEKIVPVKSSWNGEDCIHINSYT